MKYYYGYKHFKFKFMDKEYIIEIAIDNTLGKATYSAATNVLFLDTDETFGKAVGVGKNEQVAFEMCKREIEMYLSSVYSKNVSLEDIEFKEINIAKRMTVLTHNDDSTTFYIKEFPDYIKILTDKNVFRFQKERTVEKTIEINLKKLNGSSFSNLTKNYLKENDFYPTFEESIERFM